MRSKRTSQIVNTSKSPNLDKELKRLIFDTRDVNHTLGFEESPAKNESVPYFKDDSYNVNAYNQFLNQTNKCFVKSRAVNDHLEKANRIVE